MKILHTYDKVKEILEEQPETRDDYNKLLAAYWYEENYKNSFKAVDWFFRELSIGNVTHPESIMRTRRKVQQDFPELKGCSKKEEEENVKTELGYK